MKITPWEYRSIQIDRIKPNKVCKNTLHGDPVKVDLVKIDPVKIDQIKQCSKNMSKANGDSVILEGDSLHEDGNPNEWDPR